MLDGGVKQLDDDDDDDDVVSLFSLSSRPRAGWVFEPGSWRQTGRIKKKVGARDNGVVWAWLC